MFAIRSSICADSVPKICMRITVWRFLRYPGSIGDGSPDFVMADLQTPIPSNPSWERVLLARHPKRPHSLDYIQRLFTDFQELAGDRAFADDHAIVAGRGWYEDRPRMDVAEQTRRDTKQGMCRNFGYRQREGDRNA